MLVWKTHEKREQDIFRGQQGSYCRWLPSMREMPLSTIQDLERADIDGNQTRLLFTRWLEIFSNAENKVFTFNKSLAPLRFVFVCDSKARDLFNLLSLL